MLGLLATLVRDYCPEEPCRSLLWSSVELQCRRWKAGAKDNWDADLSDADLEALQAAGWSEGEVQKAVEQLDAMLRVLSQVVEVPHVIGG